VCWNQSSLNNPTKSAKCQAWRDESTECKVSLTCIVFGNLFDVFDNFTLRHCQLPTWIKPEAYCLRFGRLGPLPGLLKRI
jgi:hypothetical protein